MLRKLKLWILPIHRWTGLTVGLVIAAMAATGASLAFRPQIEPLFSSNILSVPACREAGSLDEMTKQAVEKHPEGVLDFVRITPHPRGRNRPATWIRFTDKTTYYFNPCNGAYLGQMDRYAGLFGTIEKIHRFRWTPVGSYVTGTTALFLILVMAIGGLVLWIPPNRVAFQRHLKLTAGLKGRPKLLNLHRVTGVYASILLLLSAATGLPQAFPSAKNLVYKIAGSPLPVKPGSSPSYRSGDIRLPLDAIYKDGLALAPDAQEIQFRYPIKATDPIEGLYIGQDAPHINARSFFYIDAYDGSIIEHTPHNTNSAGHKLYYWTLSWHQGLVFGLLSQILIFLGALSALVLAFSGIKSFWLRSFRRRTG